MTDHPSGPAPTTDPVEQIVRDSYAALEDLDSSEPFTGPGFIEVRRNVATYIRDLMVHSARTARRRQVDRVNQVDVRDAARHLSSSRSTSLTTVLSTIGGILLGAALSNALAMLTVEGAIGNLAVVVTSVLLVAGTALVAVAITREMM